MQQCCENCSLRFELKVYTLNRSKELMSELEKTNTKYVCMAFATEGIAEIGTFSGIGCEVFEPKDTK